DSTTRDLIEAWLTKTQLMRVLVPEELLGRMDAPSVLVLYAQDLAQTMSAEIQRELQSVHATADRAGDTPRDRERGVDIAPSMRLADRDMHATIAYIDEERFNGSNLNLSSSHVRYLLNARVPELPAWWIEGIERLWRRTDFVEEPVTLRPLIWHNQGESE